MLTLFSLPGNPLHLRYKRSYDRETAQATDLPYSPVHKVQIVQAYQGSEGHEVSRGQSVREGRERDVRTRTEGGKRI